MIIPSNQLYIEQDTVSLNRVVKNGCRMQSSEMSSYGSLPTLDSAVSSSDCEKTDAGSRAAHSLTAVDAEVQGHVYKSKLKKKWSLGQKLKCLLQRSIAIYSVLIVAIWTMFTIPIIVFYATDAKVIV